MPISKWIVGGSVCAAVATLLMGCGGSSSPADQASIASAAPLANQTVYPAPVPTPTPAPVAMSAGVQVSFGPPATPIAQQGASAPAGAPPGGDGPDSNVTQTQATLESSVTPVLHFPSSASSNYQ